MTTRVLFSIFIFLFLIRDLCYCQNNPYKLFQLRIAPGTLVDPITGTIQAGIEKRFGARIAVAFDYGLKFNKLSFDGLKYERKDYKYHKYKAEVKYFFKAKASGPSQTDHPYFSVQGFYFPQQYRKDNDWLITNGGSYHYDYSHINRKAVAASILFGDELISGRLVFDGYFGVGLKKLTIKHQPTNAVPGYRPRFILWVSPTPIDTYEGNFYRLHIPFGIKIGYAISK